MVRLPVLLLFVVFSSRQAGRFPASRSAGPEPIASLITAAALQFSLLQPQPELHQQQQQSVSLSPSFTSQLRLPASPPPPSALQACSQQLDELPSQCSLTSSTASLFSVRRTTTKLVKTERKMFPFTVFILEQNLIAGNTFLGN